MTSRSPDGGSILDIIDGMPHVIFWYTDASGVVLASVGGALRAIGLTRDATVGAHVRDYGPATEAMYQEAMAGMSGVSSGPGSWGPAARRRYLTAWGPYYQGNEKAGMVAIAMDASTLEESSLEALQGQLAAALPVLQKLAEAEAASLLASLEQARTRTITSEKSWEALLQALSWMGTKIGLPMVIVATALSLWVADKLGVLDSVLNWLVSR